MGEYEDITKTGIQPVRNPDLYGGGEQQLPPITYENALKRYQNTHNAFQAASRGYMGYEDMYDTFDNDTNFGVDTSRSRYDSTPVINGTTQDMLNNRAENQPWIEQMTNGILKGVVTAGTTFVDGIVGSIVGIGNLFAQAGQGNVNSGKEALNAFIDNPVSKWLQQVNEQFEKWLPNYYTQEEQLSVFERPENIMHANFIGDKFVKNLGFMIGAAYSGRVNAGAVAKLTGLNEARNAFKGLNIVAKDGKKLEEIGEVAKAAAKGEAYLDGKVLTETLAKEAKKMANQEWALKMYGAVTAAMGEARIEAIQNTKDWYERDKMLVNDNTQRLKQNLLNDIYREANETGAPYFTLQFDNETGSASPVLTEEGKLRYIQRLNEIDEQEAQALDQLDRDRAAVANNIFLLNTVLLSGTNLFEYGRFLAGGYNTNKKLVKDYVKKALNGAEKPYEALNKETRRAAIKAASVPFVEGGEEINQRYISTAVGLKHSADLNKFYGYKIDPDAEEDTISVLNAAIQGFKETFTDPSAWEEFLIGGLSAMVGMPAFNTVHNEDGTVQYKERKRKDGTVEKVPVKKFQMDGEFWGGIRDAKETSRKSKELTDKLNEAIQNPDFLNYWRGYSRHKALDKEKEDFLKLGDSFRFKNADNDQRISDMLMFEEAGRIQDVYDMIEDGISAKLEDVPSIREQAAVSHDGKDPFEGMTDQQVLDHVHKQAKDMQEWLPKYIEVRNNLKTVYGNDIDPDFLDTLTHQYLTIDDAEKRTQELVKTVLPDLNNILNRIAKTSGDESIKGLTNLGDLYNIYIDNKLQKLIEDAINVYEVTGNLGEFIFKLHVIDNNRQRALNKTFDENLPEEEKSKYFSEYKDAVSNIVKLNSLIAGIKNGEFKQFSPAEVESLIDDTVDLLKLIDYRSRFIDALQVLSTNPSAFTKESVKAREIVLEKLKDKQATDEYTSLVNKVSSEEGLSQKDFNEALNNPDSINSGIAASIREKITNGDNQRLKEMLKSYDDFEKLKKIVSDLMNSQENQEDNIYSNLYSSLINPDSDITSFEELEELAKLTAAQPDTSAEEAQEALNAIQEIKERLELVRAGREMLNNDKEENKKPVIKEKEEEKKDEKPKEEPKDSNSDTQHKEELQNLLHQLEDETSYPTTYLTKIANGEVNFDNYTDEEKALIIDTAKIVLNQRDRGSVIEGSISSVADRQKMERAFDESDKSQVADPTDNPKFKEAEKGSLRGMALTRYAISSLRDHKNLTPYLGQNEKQKELILKLQELKVYDFVDTGALAAVDRMLRSNGEPEGAHIVFIANPGSTTFTSDKDDKGGKLYNILLGIEITDDIRDFLKPWENNNFTNYQTINGKQYQIVGLLKNPDEENEDSKNAYWNIYNKVLPNNILKQFAVNQGKEGFYVAFKDGLFNPYYTTIRDFYSGRMALYNIDESEKQPSFADYEEAHIYKEFGDLSNVPVGGHGWAVIVRNKEGIVEPFISSGIDMSRVQSFTNMPMPNAGSVWILVPGSNGKYYYQHVEIKRLAEYDFSQDNEFVRDIKSYLATMINSKNPWLERLKARNLLKAYVYLPKLMEFSMHPSEDGMRIATFDVNTVEDAIEAIKASKARFQVSKDLVTMDPEAIDTMAKAGVLLTDYVDQYHHNANFTVNYLDDEGTPIRRQQKVNYTEGLNLSKGREEVLKTVQYNKQDYNINPETKQVFLKGKSIDGSEAQEVVFLWDIMNGNINGEEGDGLTLFTREIEGVNSYAVRYGSNNIAQIVTDSDHLKTIKDNIAKHKANKNQEGAIKRLREANKTTPKDEPIVTHKPEESAPKSPAEPIKREQGTPVQANGPKVRSFASVAKKAYESRQKSEVKPDLVTQEQKDKFNSITQKETGNLQKYLTARTNKSLSYKQASELSLNKFMELMNTTDVNRLLLDYEHFVNCEIV